MKTALPPDEAGVSIPAEWLARGDTHRLAALKPLIAGFRYARTSLRMYQDDYDAEAHPGPVDTLRPIQVSDIILARDRHTKLTL